MFLEPLHYAIGPLLLCKHAFRVSEMTDDSVTCLGRSCRRKVQFLKKQAFSPCTFPHVFLTPGVTVAFKGYVFHSSSFFKSTFSL